MYEDILKARSVDTRADPSSFTRCLYPLPITHTTTTTHLFPPSIPHVRPIYLCVSLCVSSFLPLCLSASVSVARSLALSLSRSLALSPSFSSSRCLFVSLSSYFDCSLRFVVQDKDTKPAGDTGTPGSGTDEAHAAGTNYALHHAPCVARYRFARSR